jgi:hypothetical protein
LWCISECNLFIICVFGVSCWCHRRDGHQQHHAFHSTLIIETVFILGHLYGNTGCCTSNRCMHRLMNFLVSSSPHIPSVAFMVLNNGTVLFQAVYRFADFDSPTLLTIDHGFHVASMSNQMTAIIIMMLAEHNRLAYDDPINTPTPHANAPDHAVSPPHPHHA